MVLSVSLQPLKHILGICLTEVFSQSSVWASPRWSCWVFLWRGYRCLAGWPGAGAAFTRVGMFRAWGRPRAGPRGLPALLLCSDGLLCVSDRHPCPQPSRAAPFPAWDLSWAEQRPGSWQAPARLLLTASLGRGFAARGSPGCRRAVLRNAGGQCCWLQWSLAVFSWGVSWRSEVTHALRLAARFRHSPSTKGPGSGLHARSGHRAQRAALSPQAPRTSPDSLASASAWWSPRTSTSSARSTT